MKASIRVPNNSTLWVPNINGYDAPLKILGVALLWLCRPESDVEPSYYRYRLHCSSLIESLASGELQTLPTVLQARLSSLVPGRTSVSLCVGVANPDRPTHCLSVLRGSDGLWRPQNRRIRPVRYAQGKPQLVRDSVLVLWPGLRSANPAEASRSAPTFRPLIAGRRALHAFSAEIAEESCYEIRRELSHCVMVAHLFGQANPGRINTWHDSGRITLAVDQDAGDGYVTPFRFVSVSRRPYSHPGPKPRVVVHASASKNSLLDDYPLYRSVQPEVRAKFLHGTLDSTSAEVLDEVLLTRLSPWIGVADKSGEMVDLYGISYQPDDGGTEVVCYAANRAMRYCHMLPVLRRGRKWWRPNPALLSLLRQLIFDCSPDAAMRVYRWEAIGYFMSFLGATHPDQYADFFVNYGLSIDDEERRRIAENHEALSVKSTSLRERNDVNETF